MIQSWILRDQVSWPGIMGHLEDEKCERLDALVVSEIKYFWLLEEVPQKVLSRLTLLSFFKWLAKVEYHHQLIAIKV